MHISNLWKIFFLARFYQELSKSNQSTKQVLDIKHRCLNFLKTTADEVPMRLTEKFNTLQVFHPDVLLSLNKYVLFHNLNLVQLEFCLCDWISAGIGQNDLNAQVCIISEFWQNLS